MTSSQTSTSLLLNLNLLSGLTCAGDPLARFYYCQVCGTSFHYLLGDAPEAATEFSRRHLHPPPSRDKVNSPGGHQYPWEE